MKKNTVSTLTLAKDIARAASNIKAIDIRILDLRKVTSFTDYFVVASGTSDRHVDAIADSIEFELKKTGRRAIGVEGHDHAQWVIVDFGDVVAHIFYHPMREIYAIEKLWADAKVMRYKDERPKSAQKKKPVKETLKRTAKKAIKKPIKKTKGKGKK